MRKYFFNKRHLGIVKKYNIKKSTHKVPLKHMMNYEIAIRKIEPKKEPK